MEKVKKSATERQALRAHNKWRLQRKEKLNAIVTERQRRMDELEEQLDELFRPIWDEYYAEGARYWEDQKKLELTTNKETINLN